MLGDDLKCGPSSSSLKMRALIPADPFAKQIPPRNSWVCTWVDESGLLCGSIGFLCSSLVRNEKDGASRRLTFLHR